LLIAGCAGVSREQGHRDEALYHHNWWNYYLRGKESLGHGRVEDAKADFETALGLRGGSRYGYPQDRWRVRTYGVHILEDYFPNRELGVCLLKLGQPQAAIEHLETSLHQAPSARAKYYLNLARKDSLKSSHVSPPRIDLDSSLTNAWTQDRVLVVSGMAHGAGFISEMTVNGEREFLELASPSVTFKRNIPLKEGRNVVALRARDLTGQQVEQSVEWIADWTPPRVMVTHVTRHASDCEIDGLCVDNGAIEQVKAGGRVLFDATRTPAPQSTVPFHLSVSPREPVLFSVSDRAGNETRVCWSSADFAQAGRSFCWPQLALAEGEGRSDAGTGCLTTNATRRSAARENPLINVNGAGTVLTIFNDEYCMDIRVGDHEGLRRVEVNGEDKLSPQTQGAIQFYCTHRAPLEVGTNVLTVSAVDLVGNGATQVVTVIRRVPEYLDRKYRLTLGLPPLVDHTPGDTDFAERIKRHVELGFLKEPVRFFLVEREEGWDAILKEQLLSASSLTDRRVALRIKEIMPVEVLLLGQVLRDGQGTTVYTEAVDTDSGLLLCQDDVYMETPGDMGYQLDGLVMKLEQRFPLVAARIEHLGLSGAVIDAGTGKGVQRGARFLIIRSGDNDKFESGRVMLAGDCPAELLVSRVKAERGEGQVVPDSLRGQVRVGDRVFAR